MLSDSIARFVAADYSFEERQRIASTDAGWSPELWRTFADLGWTAVPFAEEDGGLGGGAVETMLMMEQFGRALLVEPFLANVILAGGVLRRLADERQKAAFLAPLIEGSLQAALAFAEPQARFDIANVATTASKEGGGFRLNGRKTLVLNAEAAGLVIVPARTAGAQSDADGITLFAVAADADGLAIRGYPTVDAQRAAELSLDDVAVDADAVLGEIGAGFPALRQTVDEATLAVCAEAVGIMSAMHERTLDYVKSRFQFGVPIGSFQALQHRLVDCMIDCEQTRSLLYRAVMMQDGGSPEAARAVSALKYQVGTAGVRVGRESVQMHGGMGVTWELDIAHFFKRLTAIDVLFGNADHHLDRIAADASDQ